MWNSSNTLIFYCDFPCNQISYECQDIYLICRDVQVVRHHPPQISQPVCRVMLATQLVRRKPSCYR